MKNEILKNIKAFYIGKRFEKVDKDFLQFEEDMVTIKDLETIEYNLECALQKRIKKEEYEKFINPNNSILLYITGLSDEFDFKKARCNHHGGTPPDIDTDAQPSRRYEIEQYINELYGEENVAHIGSYGTFGLKAIAQDLMRIHQPLEPKLKDYENKEEYEKDCKKYFKELKKVKDYYNEISDRIPNPIHGKAPDIEKLKEAIEDVENKYPDFYSFAEYAYDMRKQLGVHAAGIVIGNEPINWFVPTYKNTNKEENKQYDRITQFDKDEVEQIGLLKLDLLVTDNLDTIAETIRLLAEQNIIIDIEKEIYENPNYEPAYRMINDLNLTGVFQLEGEGTIKTIIKRIRPSKIEHLFAINALNRPGPLDNGLVDQYVDNMDSYAPPEGMPQALAEILKPTNYCMIYQEQIMEAMQKMAGFTLKESDDIRKALGKKKAELLIDYKEKFIKGCLTLNTCDELYSEEFWTGLEKFADYCFNLSHAVLYSFLTYACAYLKVKYPAEFFAAYLTVKSRKAPEKFQEKLKEIKQECVFFGIEILPPDINTSKEIFTVKDSNIVFSISGIKTIAGNSVFEIVNEKENYKDILDFLSRVNKSKINTGKFEALVYAGCFDKLGYKREDLIENKEILYKYFSDKRAYQERKKAIVIRLKEREEAEKNGTRKPVMLKELPEPEKPEIERYKKIKIDNDMLMKQLEYTGIFFGKHPTELVQGEFDKIGKLWIGNPAHIVGLITSIKKITTKKGDAMAFIKLEDSSGVCDGTIFPSVWKNCDDLNVNDLVKCVVKTESEEPDIKVIINKIGKV